MPITILSMFYHIPESICSVQDLTLCRRIGCKTGGKRNRLRNTLKLHINIFIAPVPRWSLVNGGFTSTQTDAIISCPVHITLLTAIYCIISLRTRHIHLYMITQFQHFHGLCVRIVVVFIVSYLLSGNGNRIISRFCRPQYSIIHDNNNRRFVGFVGNRITGKRRGYRIDIHGIEIQRIANATPIKYRIISIYIDRTRDRVAAPFIRIYLSDGQYRRTCTLSNPLAVFLSNHIGITGRNNYRHIRIAINQLINRTLRYRVIYHPNIIVLQNRTQLCCMLGHIKVQITFMLESLSVTRFIKEERLVSCNRCRQNTCRIIVGKV